MTIDGLTLGISSDSSPPKKKQQNMILVAVTSRAIYVVLHLSGFFPSQMVFGQRAVEISAAGCILNQGRNIGVVRNSSSKVVAIKKRTLRLLRFPNYRKLSDIRW